MANTIGKVQIEVTPSVALIRRSKETAEQIEEILGIPHGNWRDLAVEFGHDDVAIARVTLFLKPEQLVRLAQVATALPSRD